MGKILTAPVFTRTNEIVAFQMLLCNIWRPGELSCCELIPRISSLNIVVKLAWILFNNLKLLYEIICYVLIMKLTKLFHEIERYIVNKRGLYVKSH